MRFAKCLTLCAGIGFSVSTGAWAKSQEPTPATPMGNPGEWATSADYPASALRQDLQGTVGFELAIDPQGKVTGCVVKQSSGVPVLDEVTCQLVQQRAMFHPATAKGGKPVAGTYSNRVRWVLPNGGVEAPPRPFEIAFSFVVETDGRVTDCKIIPSADTPPALAEAPVPCEQKFAPPYHDDQGNPVRRRVTILTRTTVDPVE
jgi:protein TonB